MKILAPVQIQNLRCSTYSNSIASI
jgi:hypothetical protein